MIGYLITKWDNNGPGTHLGVSKRTLVFKPSCLELGSPIEATFAKENEKKILDRLFAILRSIRRIVVEFASFCVANETGASPFLSS